jgi:hypothetical protein
VHDVLRLDTSERPGEQRQVEGVRVDFDFGP